MSEKNNPTRPHLTEGHFIGECNARIETHEQPSQKCLIPSIFFHFGAPQAPSNELCPVNRVLPEEKAFWDQAVSKITPTRPERQGGSQ